MDILVVEETALAEQPEALEELPPLWSGDERDVEHAVVWDRVGSLTISVAVAYADGHVGVFYLLCVYLLRKVELLSFEYLADESGDKGQFGRADDMGRIVGGLYESRPESNIDAVEELADLRDAFVHIHTPSDIDLAHMARHDAVHRQFVVFDGESPETGEVVG